MLQWLWRIIWGPPRTVVRPTLARVAERVTVLEAEVGALQDSLKRAWGRLSGGMRSTPDIPDEGLVGIEQLEDELAAQELEDVELASRALGAQRRFGKGE